ncbi:FAM32A protein [Ceratobasidium sp. AG-Ba]|nr:FAM32A protein [Ceratobasidium sp. AG-Ba]
MSDAYEFRPGGSLKLKGEKEKKKKHKSSSQKSSKQTILGDELVAKEKPTQSEDRESPAASGSRHESPAASSSKPSSKKTPAELRFEETQRKRRMERVAKLASQTHKDRVHDFNSKLEALSEHHDIPKASIFIMNVYINTHIKIRSDPDKACFALQSLAAFASNMSLCLHWRTPE